MENDRWKLDEVKPYQLEVARIGNSMPPVNPQSCQRIFILFASFQYRFAVQLDGKTMNRAKRWVLYVRQIDSREQDARSILDIKGNVSISVNKHINPCTLQSTCQASTLWRFEFGHRPRTIQVSTNSSESILFRFFLVGVLSSRITVRKTHPQTPRQTP